MNDDNNKLKLMINHLGKLRGELTMQNIVTEALRELNQTPLETEALACTRTSETTVVELGTDNLI